MKFWGLIALMVIIPLVIACVVAFFISWWKIFEKGGEGGWAVFVPFYNAYILGKVAGGVGFGIGFLVVVIIQFFGILVGIVAMIATDEEIAYNIIVFLFGMPYFVMRLILAFKLGGKFGCGVGIRFLLCLPYINLIPFLYLAFSKNCVYREKPSEASVGLFIVLLLLPLLFVFSILAMVAVPRFTADRTDAYVATARIDMASAQKAIVAKVFADNINVNNPKAPNPNKSFRNQTSADYREWGEWIMEVAGLDGSRWQSFGTFGVYPMYYDKKNTKE